MRCVWFFRNRFVNTYKIHIQIHTDIHTLIPTFVHTYIHIYIHTFNLYISVQYRHTTSSYPPSISHNSCLKTFQMQYMYTAPSQWLCGLRCRLQLFDCRDCVLECSWWYLCYCLKLVLCCADTALCDGRIAGLEDLYRMCVCVCVLGWMCVCACVCVIEDEGDFL